MARTISVVALTLLFPIAACSVNVEPASPDPAATPATTAASDAKAATPTATPTAAPTAAPSAVKDCGHEQRKGIQPADSALRKCIYEAFQKGEAAKLAVTRTTTEGDPITVTIETGAGQVLVTVDSTQDKFGDKSVTKHTCTALVKGAAGSGPDELQATGCSNASAPTISIP